MELPTTHDSLREGDKRFVLMLRRKLPCDKCFGYGVNIYADPRCQFGCRGGVSGHGSGSGSSTHGRSLGSGSGAFGHGHGSGFGALGRSRGSGFGALGCGRDLGSGILGRGLGSDFSAFRRGSSSGTLGLGLGLSFGTFGRGRGSVSDSNPSTVTSSSTSTKLPLILNYSLTGRLARAKRALNAEEINEINVSALNISSTPYASRMASPIAKYDQSDVGRFNGELWKVPLFSSVVILLVMMLLLTLRSRKAICKRCSRHQSASSKHHRLSMNLGEI